MSIHVSPEWLVEAWYGKTPFKSLPVLTIADKQLKITVLREHGIGMRSMTTPVELCDQQTYCFEVPNALRAFVYNIQYAKDIQLLFQDNNLQISVETPSIAIQYRIAHLAPAQDNFIRGSSKDIRVEIGSQDWTNVCKTMPQNGQIQIDCTLNKRMVTVKHSKNNWCACIMARTKATKSARFVANSSCTRFCFKHVEHLPAFGSLIFMECGVIQWQCGFVTIYLAPQDE